MKRDLHVGIAQWLAVPGQHDHNLRLGLSFIDQAAEQGIELLVFPELWVCGYDPRSLRMDVAAAAEPREGPRTAALAAAAKRAGLWLAAGSMPELAGDGTLYNTACVFSPTGELIAWHRKAHLYPPTGELDVFAAGDRITTFEDAHLGVVGLVVCFDGDFPEVARTLAVRGARLVLAPSAYEIEGAPAWDLLYPALALTHSQWWVQSNQCGSHGAFTLMGGSRILAPTGTTVAEAGRASPGGHHPAQLLAHRIDLTLASDPDSFAGLLDASRRPELYAAPSNTP